MLCTVRRFTRVACVAVATVGALVATTPANAATPADAWLENATWTLLTDANGKPLSADSIGYHEAVEQHRQMRESGARRPPTPVERGSSFVGYYQGERVNFNWPYQWLDIANSWYFGNARLTMQPDGNLVLYNRWNGQNHWASNTFGSRATQMLFQIDDNLVVYTAGYASAPWASNTAWRCGENLALLGLQDDSNMVMYCSRSATGGVEVTPYWHTNTDGI